MLYQQVASRSSDTISCFFKQDIIGYRAMNSPEKSRPWQKDYSRTTNSRREFLKISAGAVLTAGAVAAGEVNVGEGKFRHSNEQGT